MMSHRTADVIDLLAGISPGSPLDAVRNQRPQARENAQASFEALLEPAEPGTFSWAERYAVAAFVAHVHGFPHAADFYTDLLGDADDSLVAAVQHAAGDARAAGPVGVYREPDLAAESVPVTPWAPAEAERTVLGGRLAAALMHAHLLVVRPREASPEALRALVAAGWDSDGIVSLSQLIAFLTFQLRAAWGLAVLAADPAPAASDDDIEGAVR